MKYVVHRRFKDKAICGEVNLPAMTMCEEANGYVQSLEGAEEISAVTYGMTLPEPYLSEMNAKLAVAQAQMNAITEKLGN